MIKPKRPKKPASPELDTMAERTLRVPPGPIIPKPERRWSPILMLLTLFFQLISVTGVMVWLCAIAIMGLSMIALILYF